MRISELTMMIIGIEMLSLTVVLCAVGAARAVRYLWGWRGWTRDGADEGEGGLSLPAEDAR